MVEIATIKTILVGVRAGLGVEVVEQVVVVVVVAAVVVVVVVGSRYSLVSIT